MKKITVWAAFLLAALLRCGANEMEQQFASPPDAARPWVYWYFMDGNLTREGLTADLEAMKAAGIGGAIFLEVNIGIPRGPVEFMSPPWRVLFAHAVHEAERLGIQIALGTGPGWCGTGGPWVKPEQSMQHLVASATNVAGPARFDAALPRPAPRTPYFGMGTLTPELHKQWAAFYRDEFVVAFPTPAEGARLADADEKALYFREPFSSKKGVKPFLPMPAEFAAQPAAQCIATNGLLDLTAQRTSDGRLTWDVPPGNWTILRFGRTTTGQTTRPAPQPGLGLESDKFSRTALDAHYANFVGALLKEVGPRKTADAGLTMIHFDSWEMSSQNWSEDFRTAFRQRRGYDPLPLLPALLGRVVQSVEISERFLWDLRQVAQELVITNHAVRLKELGAQSNLRLSIEPYDLNPTSDLELGGIADVPMCEFWSKGFGFPAEFSCFEASSIAHTLGRSVVGAEAFTSMPGEDWRQYPGAMKDQTDWALCCGINRFTIHRYQHQPWRDRFPGMTMGAHGVYWERTQTWWDMVPAYHTYLTRCQALLRRGVPVSDILYLAGEGAPHVFRPPSSALLPGIPDRRGYNFDGCAPSTLMLATVQDGRIVLPGASYRVLVLPRFATMTPALLGKIKELVVAGATVVGAPPQKSPSLQNFPQCDAAVQKLAAEIWSTGNHERVIRDEPPPAAATPVALPSQLPKARWIWHEPTLSAPPCVRSFRREVVLPAARIAAATVQMTADNSFALFVNGSAAGTGNNFHDVIETDATAFLKAGTNVITVTVENGGDAPNPAGLLGVLAVKFSGGAELVVPTDKSWSSAEELCGPWRAAHELGPMKMLPWKISPPKPSAKPAEVYPDYASTAALLARLGVAPDFEATGDVRYIHRREGESEIYFVGNRTAQPRAAECRFRVAGKQPELWNPLTGERRELPNFSERDGRTSVPLEFAPNQSFFVIFRQSGTALATANNFPALQPVQAISGPWQVHFISKVGKPFDKTFQALENWTQRAEPEIKYFSGTASYKLSFDLKSEIRNSKSERYVDLGAVHVMARVVLNGRDLGVVWCAPWRVKIPAGLLRASGNELEITVANLWINRLIGDAGLPQEQRQTWTTRNPFKKDSPLQPSGLLGPVQLLAEH